MDIRKIKKLIELLEDSSLTEIEIIEGEESVRLARGGLAQVAPIAAAPVVTQAAAPAPAAEEAKPEEDQIPEGEAVLSPMVGTFYGAPSPDAAPFAKVGMTVSVGQTLCIVEAMKLMNEIDSDVAGKVVSIDIENATPVEFGQVLIKIDTAG